MRVATVTSAFNSSFGEFYPNVEVLNPKKSSDFKEYDLVIFTGGEDISPEMYGEKNKYSSCNRDRDTVEKVAFEHYYFNTKAKILGVCRGHQFIAAMFGGKLYQDLYFNKLNHSGYHGFDYKNLQMEFIPDKVNSMHHQGVYRIGADSARVLATYRGVAEAIVYMSTNTTSRIITVQWHPEFMGDEKFFSWIKRWTEFKTEVNVENSISNRAFHNYVDSKLREATGEDNSYNPFSSNTVRRLEVTRIEEDDDQDEEEEENDNQEEENEENHDIQDGVSWDPFTSPTIYRTSSS